MTEAGRPLFESVVIVGPGLVGGSLGQALRAKGLARLVVGVGRRQVSLDRALERGAIDEATLDLEGAVVGADLVVLATGVGLIPRQAEAVLSRVAEGAILTDVGSVKAAICRSVEEALRRAGVAAHFVGGHPLAGSEQRGVEAAREDLFRDACCILTPTEDTNRDALARVRGLWEAVGARVVELAPERHDELLAQISHLPHVAASCLVNNASDEALAFAATGFLDTTRVASGDPDLWRDICLANGEALARAARSCADALREFAAALEAQDEKAVHGLLDRAKERRDARLSRGSNTSD